MFEGPRVRQGCRCMRRISRIFEVLVEATLDTPRMWAYQGREVRWSPREKVEFTGKPFFDADSRSDTRSVTKQNVPQDVVNGSFVCDPLCEADGVDDQTVVGSLFVVTRRCTSFVFWSHPHVSYVDACCRDCRGGETFDRESVSDGIV